MRSQSISYLLDKPVMRAALAKLLAPAGALDPGSAARADFLYFDSVDWRLLRHDLCLRLRDGRVLELADGRSGEILATAPGTPEPGFAADLPVGKLRSAVDPVIEMRRLLPRLRVRLTALPVTMRNGKGKAVLRVRHEWWDCRPPARSGPAHGLGRIVLAPIRGYSGALKRAAAALEPGFAPVASLAELLHGAFAATGGAPDPGAAGLRPGLTPAMTAGAAARAIHLTLLDAMTRNEAGAAANTDSEFLHDFRVAVRRTRSALAQVDKEVLPAGMVAEAKADFRWLGRRTNRMRDLDVYLLDFPSFEATLPKEYRAYLHPFRDHLLRESRRESGAVRRMLRGQRYRRLRDAWRARLGGAGGMAEGGAEAGPLATVPLATVPVRDLAGRRIWKAYRRLLCEGRAIGAASPPAALHELRISAKRLRYLLEFFGELYQPRKTARLVTGLKGLQDVLGRFQDSQVQSERIVEFAREMAAVGTVPVETQMAMGMVAESILTRGAAARQEFHDSFERFARPKVRAIFDKLFRPAKSDREGESDRS